MPSSGEQHFMALREGREGQGHRIQLASGKGNCTNDKQAWQVSGASGGLLPA